MIPSLALVTLKVQAPRLRLQFVVVQTTEYANRGITARVFSMRFRACKLSKDQVRILVAHRVEYCPTVSRTTTPLSV